MKINFLELKKWSDIKKEYTGILNYCIDNWNNPDVKKSLEWETMVSNKFIKKDSFDLKEIEMFDEYLFETTVNLFFLKFLLNESESSNVKFDATKYSSLSEEEIRKVHEEDIEELSNTNTVYVRSLKAYGFLQKNGTVNVEVINNHNLIKREFITNALSIIRNNGKDWNTDLLASLISLDIIKE